MPIRRSGATSPASLQSLDNYYGGDTPQRARSAGSRSSRLAPVLARIGWNEKPSRQRARPHPAHAADRCAVRRWTIAAVIAEARRRYAAQASDPTALPAELRRTILGVVARHADAATWDELHASARKETTQLIKDQTVRTAGLAGGSRTVAACARPGAHRRAWRDQQRRHDLRAARLHPDQAFDFAVAHRTQVDTRVDSTSRSRYYPGLANNSLDPAMIGKLKAFADRYIAATSRRATDTTIANIVYRRQVHDTRLPAIDTWLRGRPKQ